MPQLTLHQPMVFDSVSAGWLVAIFKDASRYQIQSVSAGQATLSATAASGWPGYTLVLTPYDTATFTGAGSLKDIGRVELRAPDGTLAATLLVGGVTIAKLADWDVVKDITGSSGGDTISGPPLAFEIDGAAGDDSILANAHIIGSDMTGGAGHDTIVGRFGEDIIDGGAGNDDLYGGLSHDSLDGGDGDDFMRGEDGMDFMSGGAGFDDMHGNMGWDSLSGGDGDDWVVGGKDSDVLHGDAGIDVIYGNMGDDYLVGGADRDVMRGGQDNDILEGGDGDDWLSGDRGNDTMSGGAGADTFSLIPEAGTDRVLDFSSAQGDRVAFEYPGMTYALSFEGGDTVITLTGGHRMVLVGVSQAALGDWLAG